MTIEFDGEFKISLSRADYSNLLTYVMFGAKINQDEALPFYHKLRDAYDKNTKA